MKKSRKQNPATKARHHLSGSTTSSGSASKRHIVKKQPQSKQQAAVANGMFLYTDDTWSLRYFDQNDLHCKEREVFG